MGCKRVSDRGEGQGGEVIVYQRIYRSFPQRWFTRKIFGGGR